MRIELPINPADIPTAQHKGVRVVNGVPMFYKKNALKKFEALLDSLLASARRDPSNRIPEGVPVFVNISYYFAFPSSTPKSKRVDMSPMVQRPDGDNLSKAILDALSDQYAKDRHKGYVCVRRGFFKDDSCITTLIIRKLRTVKKPMVRICICVDGILPEGCDERLVALEGYS